jgi:hypothetical protein
MLRGFGLILVYIKQTNDMRDDPLVWHFPSQLQYQIRLDRILKKTPS